MSYKPVLLCDCKVILSNIWSNYIKVRLSSIAYTSYKQIILGKVTIKTNHIHLVDCLKDSELKVPM